MSVENSDLTIKIKSGASDAAISLIGQDGTSKHKTVSVDDLISVLTSTHKINTGILPRNTRFFSGSRSKYKIGLETIPRVRNFGVYSRSIADKGRKREIKRIPFPACLFVFDVNGEKIVRIKVFALRSFISQESDELYRFPFGNIYAGGKVCWGSAELPKIKMPMNLISVISIFFDSSFNGDLFNGTGVRDDEGNRLGSFWELITYLDGKESFPDRVLRGSGSTLASLIAE